MSIVSSQENGIINGQIPLLMFGKEKLLTKFEIIEIDKFLYVGTNKMKRIKIKLFNIVRFLDRKLVDAK